MLCIGYVNDEITGSLIVSGIMKVVKDRYMRSITRTFWLGKNDSIFI